MNSIFFFFSKVLTIFLYPFTLFFVFGIIALFKIRGFRSKSVLAFLLLFLYFFSNAYIASRLISSLESSYPPVPIESLPKADAVIVLGGMIQTLSIHPNRTELTEASDRLVDSIRIYKAGKAKKILFTGGSGLLFADRIREADLAEKIFLDLGIPKEDLILERDSRNTYENALLSEILLRENKMETIILVTSAFHMKRSAACFQKRNVTFFPFPTDFRAPSFENQAFDLWLPAPGYLEMSTLAIKEWIGYLAYQFKDYL
jgi:uncharacterized SAM-binding protein YcdF (DUF218 family)